MASTKTPNKSKPYTPSFAASGTTSPNRQCGNCSGWLESLGHEPWPQLTNFLLEHHRLAFEQAIAHSIAEKAAEGTSINRFQLTLAIDLAILTDFQPALGHQFHQSSPNHWVTVKGHIIRLWLPKASVHSQTFRCQNSMCRNRHYCHYRPDGPSPNVIARSEAAQLAPVGSRTTLLPADRICAYCQETMNELFENYTLQHTQWMWLLTEPPTGRGHGLTNAIARTLPSSQRPVVSTPLLSSELKPHEATVHQCDLVLWVDDQDLIHPAILPLVTSDPMVAAQGQATRNTKTANGTDLLWPQWQVWMAQSRQMRPLPTATTEAMLAAYYRAFRHWQTSSAAATVTESAVHVLTMLTTITIAHAQLHLRPYCTETDALFSLQVMEMHLAAKYGQCLQINCPGFRLANMGRAVRGYQTPEP
ncbi:hypothetical protein H4R35_003769 [Dimargaris xerosporica]|nr:hypothetical protein H4R35_003769 [Dimargaris xerosporica]